MPSCCVKNKKTQKIIKQIKKKEEELNEDFNLKKIIDKIRYFGWF